MWINGTTGQAYADNTRVCISTTSTIHFQLAATEFYQVY